MKNTIKIFVFIACVFVTFAACKEDKLQGFQGGSDVYVTIRRWPSAPKGQTKGYTVSMPVPGQENEVTWEWKGRIAEVIDSMAITFARMPAGADTIVLVPVSVMGSIAPYDRDFSFDMKLTNATENVDFEILGSYIPAGRQAGGILVRMKDTNLNLEADEYTIDFKLTANENFTVRYDSIARKEGIDENEPLVTTLGIRLKGVNNVQKPAWWGLDQSTKDVGYYYYGKWSSKKAFILTNEIGFPESDFFSADGVPSTFNIAYGKLFKDYIIERENAGDPVKTDDGQLMDYGYGEAI